MKRLCEGSCRLIACGVLFWGSIQGGLAAPAESVYYGETGRISGFDPARAMDVYSALAVAQIYEGLVQYAYLDRPYRIEACLAESPPLVSPDGLDYTFRLRRGIYFQDDPCFIRTAGRGRELTADDFVYSIKRVADIKVASTGYWAFRGRIAGLDAFREQSARGTPDYSKEIEGLKALDRFTLRIRLTRPFPSLLWILAMNYAFAVPREAVDYYGADFVNHPVGTGPYILRSHIHNYRLEFVRNPKWAETGRVDTYPGKGAVGDQGKGLLRDAGLPMPFVDRIVQYVIGDPSSQWLMFLSGQLETSGIARDNWDAVMSANRELAAPLKARGIIMDSVPALDTSYIGFNMDDPVVGQNRPLRQAMMCAFDRQKWVEFQNGRVMPASGPIPPAMAVRDNDVSLHPFNLDRARELLKEAGYPGGIDPRTGRRLELSLELGSGGSDTRETAEVIASFMEKIGVVISPSFNNWPTLLKKIEQRRAQMFLMSWVADYPDPENFLQLFYGPNVTPGANRTNYRNAEFDGLYERAGLLPEGPEKRALYAQMERRVMEDCPWLFIHHSMSFGLRHPWLENFKRHDFPYGMSKYLKIDETTRTGWQKKTGTTGESHHEPDRPKEP
jgi:ABC-type transport system substrate-binding protein